ncbi:MAG: hypothetical protein ACE5JD_01345 [Candidatus Methylomirabilia bacterium]
MPIWVTALFDTKEAVDRALVHLLRAGLPRDLIEVAVSPQAAARFYARAVRTPGRQTLRYAVIGGFVGLIAGATLSLALIALPGLAAPFGIAIIQLIGPNLATLAGAALGGAIGIFVRRHPSHKHARAGLEPSAVLVVVHAQGMEDAAVLAELLSQSGGRDPKIEP